MRTIGQARVSAALLLGSGLLLTGCGSGPEQDAPATVTAGSDETARAKPASRDGGAPGASPTPGLRAERESGYLGVLVARETVDVAAEVAGRIESVSVRVGDRVRQGEEVARVDTRPLERALQMARASLRAARAEVQRSRTRLDEARTRFQRRSALEDTFSREELASAEMEVETAEANLEAARARAAEQEIQVEQLAGDLARAVLRAPFEGTVSIRYLDKGARVAPGMPVVRLINSDEMVVRFAVPPEEVHRLELGDRLHVDLGDLASPGERRLGGAGSWQGSATATVDHVAPEIDGASQLVFVEARLEEPDLRRDGQVRSGQVARVHPADAYAAERGSGGGGTAADLGT